MGGPETRTVHLCNAFQVFYRLRCLCTVKVPQVIISIIMFILISVAGTHIPMSSYPCIFLQKYSNVSGLRFHLYRSYILYRPIYQCLIKLFTTFITKHLLHRTQILQKRKVWVWCLVMYKLSRLLKTNLNTLHPLDSSLFIEA